jgi:hypothetical protein
MNSSERIKAQTKTWCTGMGNKKTTGKNGGHKELIQQ